MFIIRITLCENWVDKVSLSWKRCSLSKFFEIRKKRMKIQPKQKPIQWDLEVQQKKL